MTAFTWFWVGLFIGLILASVIAWAVWPTEIKPEKDPHESLGIGS